tara:strand:+ start:4266 stop:7634 length:3369 start_codon:yes stop_codon:yes gene_type:complete
MQNRPDFIDNLDGNSMANALRKVLENLSVKEVSISNIKGEVDEIRIATAYFSPEGFSRISSMIKDIPSIKLMLGTDPLGDSERWQKKLNENENKFFKRKFQEKLKAQEESLRLERNHIPFSKSSRSSLRQLVDSLKAGNMQVKRYEENFLHAKAYIFTPKEDELNKNYAALIAGSSNLTASGLSTNLELNLGCYEKITIEKSKKWFDKLWEDAKPFNLADFFEEIFDYKSPYEIFLRVLWELYGKEIEEDKKVDNNLPLTTFQKHGVARAMRLIKETGGVIIADEVGLGKSFIAGEIMKIYDEQCQRCLLICPAALRDSSWKKFRSDYKLFLETHSYEEVAQDIQLRDPILRPNANFIKLERNIEEYKLIIIDEAHNYRNPSSPTRHDVLRSLLYGKRKDLLLLTATPVNNSLWDLYHLTRFFLKQDSYLSDKGIISIKRRFTEAMQTNPNNLSPDVLYPIVDATTVKRTRQFIKKHYPNDQITLDENNTQTIVFPEPKAVSVRYRIDDLLPGLFDLIESFLNPEEPDCLNLARYNSDNYLKKPNTGIEGRANVITGLLLSGLLKRFESSTGAFKLSILRLIETHEKFLIAIEQGFVITTDFLKETTGTDDEEFEEILFNSDEKKSVDEYHIETLKNDVEDDLEKLKIILNSLNKITPDKDPKLKVLVNELIKILKDANSESATREERINKRKVLIFSFYADTVKWIEPFLKKSIESISELESYRGRIAIVIGTRTKDDLDKATAAAKFAPITSGKSGDPDEIDILITTDVLAEGVNLQQARHIINYDLPWNPMRLVQRHGRIDRIGSQHKRVFLRTIFPAQRLDDLLGLEEKISNKIAMAAASVGIVSPVSNIESTNREFTETREEIQKLINEDPSLYERGGTKAGVQSGEEYRQTLRKELKNRHENIINMPWKSGSGICKGKDQGIFYCAKVGDRVYLRFVNTDENWKLKTTKNDELKSYSIPSVDIEIGRCLRLIECQENESLVMDQNMEDAAYDMWLVAQNSIYEKWMFETDPINLQPQLRPINIKVADYIRNNIPTNIDQNDIDIALEIIESPWDLRDMKNLREWFNIEDNDSKSSFIIKKVLASGLEPFKPQKPLPPIKKEDIELIVWMGIIPEKI